MVMATRGKVGRWERKEAGKNLVIIETVFGYLGSKTGCKSVPSNH